MHYTTINWQSETFYIVATTKGLAYIGNNEEEMFIWLESRTDESLTRNEMFCEVYKKQLQQYINGKRTVFTESLDIVGTTFQQKVWQALQTIPYGAVTTYSEIAKLMGQPTAVRAVANAIGKNPILIVVPCHRVIGKNGQLTGFRSGLPLKEKLLKLEKSI